MLPRVIDRGDIVYPLRTPRSPPYLAAACVHGDAFLSACSCARGEDGTRAVPGVIFFGRRHVRANIAVYAYLYGIKNHPSLKMHRLLHSRRAESSPRPRRAEAFVTLGWLPGGISFSLNCYYFIETFPQISALPDSWFCTEISSLCGAFHRYTFPSLKSRSFQVFT